MRKTLHLKLAVVLAAALAVSGWTLLPASSHVADWTHNWTQHIRPKTDARYYTKAQTDFRYERKTLPLGATLSGVFSAAGPAGSFGLGTIEFDQTLPAAPTPQYAAAFTAECPGPGQAAAGYLCIYPGWNFSMTFSNFRDPGSAGVGVTRKGTILYFDSSHAQGNVRGTWTVRAHTTLPAPAPRVAARPRSSAGS